MSHLARRSWFGAFMALALVVGLGAAGCSSDAQDTAATGTVISVVASDFSIKLDASQVMAGDVTLSVENHGPDTHELVVVRSDGTDLPLRSDGITIDEDALEPVIAGAFEDAPPGTSGKLRLQLTAGRYVMFCNMAGHYLGGMHAQLDVR